VAEGCSAGPSQRTAQHLVAIQQSQLGSAHPDSPPAPLALIRHRRPGEFHWYLRH
jgi:hypothetical protein